MPDSIERTIYKLEIDGSAYIDGADKLSASTNKLSQAQEAANKKLAELNKQQQTLKKTLDETNAVIKANEKETLELTKQLNALKDADKGTTVEANKLKAALRDISVNTKEFRAEAKELSSNLSSTTNQIKIQTKEVKAAESANKNFSGALTKAYTSLSRIASIIPGLGIGTLVGLVSGPLIGAFTRWISTLDKAATLLQSVIADASKAAGADLAKMELFRSKLNDLTLSESERIKIAKEYNKTADEGNQIDLKQIDNITLLNKLIDAQVELIKKRALATAAENVLAEKAAKVFEFQLELDTKFPQADRSLKNAEKAVADTQKRLGILGKLNLDELIAVSDLPEEVLRSMAIKNERFKVLLDDRTRSILLSTQRNQKLFKENTLASAITGNLAEAQQDFENTARILEPFLSVDGLTTKTKESTKKIINIYQQELQKLKADIAKLDEKGFTDEDTITKAVEEDFKKRSLAFKKAFKNKQLTAEQLTSLQGFLKDLKDLTLKAQLKDFNERKEAYLKAISDEIVALQNEETAKRISAIQNSFERERQQIIAETDKTAATLKVKRDKQIADILKDAASHGLTKADVAPLIAEIEDTYSKLMDDLKVIKAQRLQQLSFDTFEKLSEDAKRLLDSGNLGVSQGSLFNIKAQTELFLKGKISYKEYQKELSKIAQFEASERFRLEKLYLESEIRVRQAKLASDKALTTDQIKRLEDEIRKLQQQLADAEKGNLTTTAGNKNKDDGDRLKKLVAYASAIGQVAESVIKFWQVANEAEEKALDRSISLQEKRVTQAQRIADRGNAEYLKAEEDRLNELNVKRENAARKQLGIDAALQASQLLVGITGAIAKIATPGVGVAETIAAMAVIVGSLAAGYGIVKSLQGNQPHLAEGTTYVQRGKNKPGKDTIPAMLDEGEAVTSAQKNKQYHPTIKAIHEGTIPAEQLNQFVNNYHKIKAVPQPNYERIKEAAELHIGHDGRMSVLLNEQNKLLKDNNELQMRTIKTLHKLGVNVSLDQRGFAVTQMEVIEQLERSKYK